MNEQKRPGRVRSWAKACKVEVQALLLASRHPDTPWVAKVWLIGTVAYALSPIDLIPDFIPGLGYLDDLILLPFCLWIGMRMVPTAVMDECRRAAREASDQTPKRSIGAALVVILLWGVGIALTVYAFIRFGQS